MFRIRNLFRAKLAGTALVRKIYLPRKSLVDPADPQDPHDPMEMAPGQAGPDWGYKGAGPYRGPK